jgi:hypothetical protein
LCQRIENVCRGWVSPKKRKKGLSCLLHHIQIKNERVSPYYQTLLGKWLNTKPASLNYENKKGCSPILWTQPLDLWVIFTTYLEGTLHACKSLIGKRSHVMPSPSKFGGNYTRFIGIISFFSLSLSLRSRCNNPSPPTYALVIQCDPVSW